MPIVPLPVPAVAVVKLKVCCVKVAVTLLAASIVTLHAPAPLHAPLQLVNVEKAAGVGVSVTTTPLLYVAQPAPQLIPAGALPIVPLPVPAVDVVRLNVGTKFAVTLLAASIVTEQAPEPLHAPPQAVKADPADGVGVNVTTTPPL